MKTNVAFYVLCLAVAGWNAYLAFGAAGVNALAAAWMLLVAMDCYDKIGK